MWWELVEWSERVASILKITGLNPSGGSELAIRSDLLLTARDGSTLTFTEFACLLCCLGNTLLSAPRASGKGWVGAIQILKFFFFMWFVFRSRGE
jgi:hypothetical protein